VAVGFDNIDVAACTKRGVAATNTPGVLDETTADFAWTLLMAVARRLSRGRSAGAFGQLEKLEPGSARRDGRVGEDAGDRGIRADGRAVARRASGFQMKVVYTDAVRAPEGVEKELKAEFREMNALLGESDFISLHVPLLPETRRLFDARTFAQMKPTAFLINTSRGPVVDEASAGGSAGGRQDCGRGAGCLREQPLIYPGLKRANVVLAPHIASASLETRTKMACIAAENVVSHLKDSGHRTY